MPRLQILVHKSYHPYLEKNKQRVREDEAKAAAEEAELEQLRIDVESEARLAQLRQRAGSPLPTSNPEDDDLPSTSSTSTHLVPGLNLIEKHRKAKARAEKAEKKKKDRLDFDFPSETARRDEKRAAREREKERGRGGVGGDGKGEEREKVGEGARGMREVDSYDVDENGRGAFVHGGHINFFAELENDEGKSGQTSLDEIAKKKQKEKEDPFTMYLSRSEKETKPWYTDRDLKRIEEKEIGEEAERRRERDKRKDVRSKTRNDPLTHLNSLLSTSQPKSNPRSMLPPSNPHAARAKREMSERERALALIASSRPASGWADTPSSVGGSWEDRFEREKARAGGRYFADGTPDSGWERRNRIGGRSWEV